MELDCFVEFTCISTIIWFVLHYVLDVKFTKRFIIVPIATFAICFYLLLGRFDYKYIFGVAIVNILLPILCTKDVKKTVVFYIAILTSYIGWHYICFRR